MLNSNGGIEVAVLHNDTSDQSTNVNRFFQLGRWDELFFFEGNENFLLC